MPCTSTSTQKPQSARKKLSSDDLILRNLGPASWLQRAPHSIGEHTKISPLSLYPWERRDYQHCHHSFLQILGIELRYLFVRLPSPLVMHSLVSRNFFAGSKTAVSAYKTQKTLGAGKY